MQRGIGIMFKQQWRRRENRQLPWEGNGSSRVDNKRKADGEHPEDPEREDWKWMKGNKRKIVEEVEESMLRNPEVLEGVGESRGEEGIWGDTGGSGICGMEENEEEDGWRTDGERQFEEEGGDLNLERVRQGREEEMKCMVNTLGCSSLVRGKKRCWKRVRLRPRRNGTIDRSNEEGRWRSCIREMSTRGVRFQTKTKGSATRRWHRWRQRSIVCIRCWGAREETRTGPGRSETQVHWRQERAPQRWMWWGRMSRTAGRIQEVWGMRKAASGWEDDSQGDWWISGFNEAEQLQRFHHPRLMCVSLCMATTSRSQPRIWSWGRWDRGCANGSILRCVPFLALENVMCARFRSLEETWDGQKKGWSTWRGTDAAKL